MLLGLTIRALSRQPSFDGTWDGWVKSASELCSSCLGEDGERQEAGPPEFPGSPVDSARSDGSETSGAPPPLGTQAGLRSDAVPPTTTCWGTASVRSGLLCLSVQHLPTDAEPAQPGTPAVVVSTPDVAMGGASAPVNAATDDLVGAAVRAITPADGELEEDSGQFVDRHGANRADDPSPPNEEAHRMEALLHCAEVAPIVD